MKCFRSLLGPAMVFAMASYLLFPLPVLGDQVIADDLIVQGSGCFGYDCVNGESFDENTIRLKENNTRILFEDTSAAPGDPDQDWWLIANDSSNGGPNMFAISDFTGIGPSNTNRQGIPYSTETVPYDPDLYHPSIYCTSVGSGGNTNFPPYPDGFFECPATIDIDTNKPEQLLFMVDAGTNSFQIRSGQVLVGTDASPRRLVNVASGNQPNDVINVGQLENAEQGLAFVQGLNGTSVAGLPELQTNLNDAEQSLPVLAADFSDVEQGVTTNRQAIDRNVTSIIGLSQQLAGNQSDLNFLRERGIGLDTNGGEATASGEGSASLGSGARANGRDTAVGAGTTVDADGSVAVGNNSTVQAVNAVAVGADSQVNENAAGGIALGQEAQVGETATGGVALGQGTENDESDTLSVGGTGTERRISHVAAASTETDLVNRSQLQEAEVRMQSGVDRVSEQLDELDERSDHVGALSAALSALVPNGRAGGITQVALGLGHYSGENAVAAGLFVYLSDGVLFNAGVSSAFATNSTAGRAGFVISW